MKDSILKYLYVFVFILVSFAPRYQGEDFRQAFGHDYKKADEWMRENYSDFKSKAVVYGIPVRKLQAIVFPEIIRYNAVYDFIETTALSLLYVESGNRYADFSIGCFQMKPSFAEQIEEEAEELLTANICQQLGFSGLMIPDTKENREARITRLSSLEGQLQYLLAFYMICELKLKDEKFNNETDRLRLLATSYNSGYNEPISEIRSAMKKKEFYTGKFITSSRYNYSDISVFWYNDSQ